MPKTDIIETPPPRENPTLIGHEAVEARFAQEFGQGRVHHAYLITGPKGIGKATLAYRFARHILSQGAQARVEEAPSMSLFGEEPAPLTTHDSRLTTSLDMSVDDPLFRRIAAGSHTDLLVLSPAYDAKKGVEKNIISVDEARKVPEFLSLTPAEGDWRVVIVDAVDQLNANAANALLKILEEPPPRAILFLICHELGAILPTIRSRCRLLRLQPPSADSFGIILNQLAPAIETHDYAALYALSFGSPGHAITLYQEGALGWYEGWLNAMQTTAPLATRQKFADAVGAQKSAASWDAIIYCWHIAMQRISLFPHYASDAPILRKEEELLANIAAATSLQQRTRWVEAGNRLIWQTETFNLDKRQTIRLLTDAAQLDMLAA